jgi:hypothetical protein
MPVEKEVSKASDARTFGTSRTALRYLIQTRHLDPTTSRGRCRVSPRLMRKCPLGP